MQQITVGVCVGDGPNVDTCAHDADRMQTQCGRNADNMRMRRQVGANLDPGGHRQPLSQLTNPVPKLVVVLAEDHEVSLAFVPQSGVAQVVHLQA